MTLGMSLSLFTQVHVALSLIGIGTGLLVVFGLISGRLLRFWTGLFLLTTVLTCVTGFLFPFKGITPGIVVGILSMVLLALAIAALYLFHLAGGWRTTFAITAAISLYLNVFVLIVQLFEKVPALHALAPTQSEPPFKIAQLLALALFVVLTVVATRGFRNALAGRA
jgi:hypothetical protein